MRRSGLLVGLLPPAVLVSLLIALIQAGMPLGVRGEWEWPRLKVANTAFHIAWGFGCVILYALFVARGVKPLSGEVKVRREWVWLIGLLGASIAVQVGVQLAAPDGYGLTKWVTIALPGSSGYHKVAKGEMGQTSRFLADYPDWIQRQDALHIGTHPPGLFLVARAAQDFTKDHPAFADWIVEHLPTTVSAGFQQILGPLPRHERAAIALMGMATLFLCASVVVPLYLLARSSLTPAESWVAAAFWPILPSAILFQPTADTAFPLLSCTAWALAAWSGGQRQRWIFLFASGVVLGCGNLLTLAFLPVGLVVAILTLADRRTGWTRRIVGLAVTGLGFVMVVGLFWWISKANPLVIWWWNQKNHARFYVEYPRSYASWVVVNVLELAVGIGIPTVWRGLPGFVRRRAPLTAWATLGVLVLLNLSGRNLSEVARLWIPLMPGLVLAAGTGGWSRGHPREPNHPLEVFGTLMLLGVQTLALQGCIQVVYPI